MIVEGDYLRDGAVCVRGAFTADEVALAAAAIDANLASLSPRAKRASADDDGAFVEDFCNWQRMAAMEEFIRSSPAAAIAAELTGASTIRLYHDHVLVKEPGTRQRTPWHQDLPYYNVDGVQNASMWFPVDPVPRASTLEFVAGTHLGPWYMPRTFLDEPGEVVPRRHPGRTARLRRPATGWRILGWELEPGDAVFFHMLTVHGAGGRRAARAAGGCCRCGSSATTWCTRPRDWTTSPPFPGLDDELPAGAPLDHPLFPVLWRRCMSRAADHRRSAIRCCASGPRRRRSTTSARRRCSS